MNERQKPLFLVVTAILLLATAFIPADGPYLTSPVRLLFPVGILLALIVIKKFYGGTRES